MNKKSKATTSFPSTSPIDSARLKNILGTPALARLIAALRRRLELGRTLNGSLTLTEVTPSERAACDALLGRRPTDGATITLDLDALASRLREAEICPDLTAAVEAVTGPAINRIAAAETHKAAWNTTWSEATAAFAHKSALEPWIDELMQSGVVKRLCNDDPIQALQVLRDVVRVVAALPATAEPLAAFAARTLGDAHALDPGTPRATLVVRAAARLGGIDFSDNAEGRRAAWAGVGVMCDELSAPVLVLNLPASGNSPLARLLRESASAGEPLHLSLRLLLRYPLAPNSKIADHPVFVCENPTIVALAAAELCDRCAPLVCTGGQPSPPVQMLLRQLRAVGAQLHYHGDFDPPGLAIARHVMTEGGALPWRFGAGDYREAPKGVVFQGDPGPTPWDPGLAEVMRSEGRIVHEEAVFQTLMTDLKRSAVA